MKTLCLQGAPKVTQAEGFLTGALKHSAPTDIFINLVFLRWKFQATKSYSICLLTTEQSQLSVVPVILLASSCCVRFIETDSCMVNCGLVSKSILHMFHSFSPKALLINSAQGQSLWKWLGLAPTAVPRLLKLPLH